MKRSQKNNFEDHNSDLPLFFTNLQIQTQPHKSIIQNYGFFSQSDTDDFPSPIKLTKQNRSESPNIRRDPLQFKQLPDHQIQLKKLIYDNEIYLGKLFRRAFLVVLFSVRIFRLARNSPWRRQNSLLNMMKSTTLKLENTKEYRILNWCNGILMKSLTSVKEKLFDFYQNPNDAIKKDQSLLKIVNASLFLFQTLSTFTNPAYFCKELNHYMFAQLFLNQREVFTRFVSERTDYLFERNRTLPLDQQSLIVSETVIMVHLFYNLCRQQHQSVLLLKILASLLQYFFINHFINMKTHKTNLVYQYQKVTQEQNFLNLELTEEVSNPDILIDGLFDEQQLNQIFSFKSGIKERLQKEFDEALNNLILNLQSI